MHDDTMQTMKPRFEIGEAAFTLDGQPFRVLAGALHYFRVHPDQWAHRLRAARQMGLNTIETYVAWNEHAPSGPALDFSGRLDLGRFLDAVAAEGMYAIVRPGPYICAEFDNGGLPGWLTSQPGIRLRSSDERYLEFVEDYLAAVIDVVAPRQVDSGGPVILMQIENEYGAYGDDDAYLRRLVDLHRRKGVVVPLTTVDQPTDAMLRAGGLPDVLRTASFGSRAAERLRTLREHQPRGPLMCGEFWDGWFDSWGGFHHTTDAEAAAEELDAILSAGASVNVYMFHGGTNFGLTSGANHKGRYVPIGTSYDYDAPLDERGRPTAKYWAFRDVISRHFPVPDDVPTDAGPTPSFEVSFTSGGPLHALPAFGATRRFTDGPPSFDALGHYRGVISYSCDIAEHGAAVLTMEEVRDRAWVRVDGRQIAVLDRSSHERAVPIPAGTRVELIVEDQGRVNYGPALGEPKGLIGPVRLGGAVLLDWDVAPLDLAAIPTLDLPEFGDRALEGPQVVRGMFTLDRAGDLVLDTSSWGKGFAWVNGQLLGRYWRRGPQRTLFVPGPVTVAGENTLTVLEMEVLGGPSACFVSDHDLGPTEE